MNRTYTSNTTTSYSLRPPQNGQIRASIIEENLSEVRRLVTRERVNNVIDDRNGLRAIHLAIRIGNKSIIEYLLSLDADLSIKNEAGEDSYQLSLKYQNEEIIQYLRQEKTRLSKKNNELDDSLKKEKERHTYLLRSVDAHIKKNEELNNEVNTLRREKDELNKQVTTLKRKYSELDSSYEGLLSEIRKKK